MTYDTFLEALATSEIRKYVRDGISYSYPVMGLCNGKLAECFFLYSVSLTDGNIAEGPISILHIDSEAKSLLNYHETTPSRLDNSLNCELDVFWEADRIFRELYPCIHRFAFSKTIKHSEAEMLKEFNRVFRVLVNNSFYELYKSLFGDFIRWMEQ